MDLDQLDNLFAQARSPQSQPEIVGMQWREWQWREADKMLDTLRQKYGKRPLSSKMRAETLEKYIEKCSTASRDQDSD